MKPHLRKVESIWTCIAGDDGIIGEGFTAISAYSHWKHNKDCRERAIDRAKSNQRWKGLGSLILGYR